MSDFYTKSPKLSKIKKDYEKKYKILVKIFFLVKKKFWSKFLSKKILVQVFVKKNFGPSFGQKMMDKIQTFG